ncbi:unnamed protein product [Ectocarpus sp. 12 AP-2014]
MYERTLRTRHDTVPAWRTAGNQAKAITRARSMGSSGVLHHSCMRLPASRNNHQRNSFHKKSDVSVIPTRELEPQHGHFFAKHATKLPVADWRGVRPRRSPSYVCHYLSMLVCQEPADIFYFQYNVMILVL